MSKILKGAPVAAALNEQIAKDVETLAERGIHPKLAVVRVGERGDDIAYEKGVASRCEKVGVGVRKITLPVDTAQAELTNVLKELNADAAIHGVLLFRPLPKGIDESFVCNTLSPAKDVDGITDASLAGVFAGIDTGFPPCTPSACMEMLDHYGVALQGKKAVVIGRSLVVGKPVAMMLLGRHATVTICHTRTTDMYAVCREAEVLIVAAGRADVVDKSYLSPNQTVIDVGINVNKDGKLCGDVKFAEAEPIVAAITPVPGGVGTVTTSVLVKHVVEAAKKQSMQS
ncbi:MAG: bifunctional 5,10-methylenetetrahydrofolate dehydrogenase/5,10-methenyltetrahydrofolate cyclohydrolase [Clostridiales bacterium]|jgi:methylenetetrahydrofolate dehydrogenase (NADP+)/methenyltetrahydrofolate cyclohydrolase|nr:bifunctional 5,10-methylenetetrahydrofolate dehydrogenase/5,10-methenyltetrahydrofolate cyclohydrolase [Clostridiales bacterium]